MTTEKKWLVKGDEVGYISDHDDQSFGMFCPVAVIYDEECARLIAAAPELLEACQKALSIIGFGIEYDIINAAIAKATGEQE